MQFDNASQAESQEDELTPQFSKQPSLPPPSYVLRKSSLTGHGGYCTSRLRMQTNGKTLRGPTATAAGAQLCRPMSDGVGTTSLTGHKRPIGVIIYKEPSHLVSFAKPRKEPKVCVGAFDAIPMSSRKRHLQLDRIDSRLKGSV
eukprot:1839297-Amphidinium_carterae.1